MGFVTSDNRNNTQSTRSNNIDGNTNVRQKLW